MGQKHQGHARQQDLRQFCHPDLPGTYGRHTAQALAEGRSHKTGRPDTPLPVFRQSPYDAQQHDHAQGQQCCPMAETVKVCGGIVRRAEHGRKPEPRQTVQSDIAGHAFGPRLRQEQGITPGGDRIPPFCGSTESIVHRLEKHRHTGQTLPHVQHEDAGALARRHGRKPEAQPECAIAPWQFPQVRTAPGQGVSCCRNLADVHAATGVKQVLRIGKEGDAGRGQCCRQGGRHGQRGQRTAQRQDYDQDLQHGPTGSKQVCHTGTA